MRCQSIGFDVHMRYYLHYTAIPFGAHFCKLVKIFTVGIGIGIPCDRGFINLSLVGSK